MDDQQNETEASSSSRQKRSKRNEIVAQYEERLRINRDRKKRKKASESVDERNQRLIRRRSYERKKFTKGIILNQIMFLKSEKRLFRCNRNNRDNK